MHKECPLPSEKKKKKDPPRKKEKKRKEKWGLGELSLHRFQWEIAARDIRCHGFTRTRPLSSIQLIKMCFAFSAQTY